MYRYNYNQQEELLKIKYRNLRNNLYSIKVKLADINYSFDTLYNSIISNITIDKKIPNEDAFMDIKESIKNVSEEMSGSLLSYVNDALNSSIIILILS